jgi:hypothetical protein
MEEEKVYKKRGRKPKGGKIIKNEVNDMNVVLEKKNIILHLKCRLSDIQKNDMFAYNPNINCDEPTPYEEDGLFSRPEFIEVDSTATTSSDDDHNANKDRQKKIIYQKLSELERNLHTNNINKRSACFWCTCDFDTPQIYIPAMFIKEHYNVYGCFCSPECACSYLFHERIDDNTKFERYQLLNYVYGGIYNYEKNIKMAPNPYYTLNKFMGNLDIHEYRQLLTFERLLLVIDKPLTKVYPELHEDNNDFETMYDNKIVLKKVHKVEKSKILQNVFNSK